MREDGFYWVRDSERWVVAEWNGNWWYESGDGEAYKDERWNEIDERRIARGEAVLGVVAPNPQRHMPAQVRAWAGDYEKVGGHGVIVCMLKEYAGMLDSVAPNPDSDAAKRAADEAIERLERTGKEIGLSIYWDGDAPEPEEAPKLNITDWRDLRVGDVVEYVAGNDERLVGKKMIFSRTDEGDNQRPIRLVLDGIDVDYGWPTKWRFIRRP